ncbi:hypothetical protein JCM6882_005514 [Rhodosporidiobolus microsporus]
MPRTKPSAAATSASTSRGGAAKTVRTSNPPRTAASKKRVSYFEQDEEDEEMDEGDTTLVNPEEGEEGDFREETPTASAFAMASILKEHLASSRAKGAKAESAKVEKLMKEQFESGKKSVDSLVAKYFEENDALVSDLKLDDTRGFSRLDTKTYSAVFTEQETLKVQLVGAIDEFQKEINPGDEEWIEVAKQALNSRPQRAKKAYKKLVKSTTAVVDERRAMAELHQGAAQEAYRHFKGLVRL